MYEIEILPVGWINLQDIVPARIRNGHMAISLLESQNIDELAGVLYEMLPGSGNPRLSFPTERVHALQPSPYKRREP